MTIIYVFDLTLELYVSQAISRSEDSDSMSEIVAGVLGCAIGADIVISTSKRSKKPVTMSWESLSLPSLNSVPEKARTLNDLVMFFPCTLYSAAIKISQELPSDVRIPKLCPEP
jgi:hypothetical protein